MTFGLQKSLFGFLVVVCDRVGDEDKFSYENVEDLFFMLPTN